MDGIVQGVQIILLAELGQIGLAGGGAVFGFHAQLQILLGGIGDHLAQKLGKLRGVLRFLMGGLFPIQADLGIALPMGHAGHGQIHANLGAFAGEVGAQTVDDLLLDLSGDICAKLMADAHHMLGGPGHIGLLLYKLGAGDAALGTLLRGLLAFMNITAHRTYPFFHRCYLQCYFLKESILIS